MSAEGRGWRGHLPLILALVLIGGGLIAANRLLPNIDLQQTLRDVGHSLGAWTYAIAALGAFLETGAFVGLVLPGETVVILAGAVAGQGETILVVTIGVVWIGAFAGDSVSFLLGHSLGRDFMLRHGSRVRITPERFATVESYFRRHGGKTIVVGRFISLVRALAPFSAGSSGMAYRAFAPFSVLGTGMWAATYVLIGYFASQSLDRVTSIAGKGSAVFAGVVAAIVAIVVAVRWLRSPENRERLTAAMERRPALRPVVAAGRRLRAPARFVGGRLTPGGLGLELTALLAAAAVGIYVVVAYGTVLVASPGPTAGDHAAFEIADGIRSGWLTDVAKAFTDIGSGFVVYPLAAVAGGILVIRRRWTEAAVLAAAVLAIAFGVSALKEAVDRPRPVGPLAGFGGSSFPSGHAAQSVIYPWVALTLTLRLRPGIPGASALIAAGIAVAAAIGLSRVYLRVHYLSDVSAGWAFGIAVFALAAIVALVVGRVRHNPASDAAGGQDRD